MGRPCAALRGSTSYETSLVGSEVGGQVTHDPILVWTLMPQATQPGSTPEQIELQHTPELRMAPWHWLPGSHTLSLAATATYVAYNDAHLLGREGARHGRL